MEIKVKNIRSSSGSELKWEYVKPGDLVLFESLVGCTYWGVFVSSEELGHGDKAHIVDLDNGAVWFKDEVEKIHFRCELEKVTATIDIPSILVTQGLLNGLKNLE